MCVALRAPKTRTRIDPFKPTFLVGEPLQSGSGSRSRSRHDLSLPLVPSIPLEIACVRRAPTKCHSRRRERAYGPRGQHTFAGNGVRAATVRVEASRRSICCPYDALPASAPSVSTPPPGHIAAATTATTTTTTTSGITTTSIAHRDTVVSRLPISRPSASSGPHSAAGSPSRSPTPPEPTFLVPQDPTVSFPLPLILPRFRYEASSLRIRRRPSRALPPPSPSSLFVALSSFPITFSSVFVPFNRVNISIII